MHKSITVERVTEAVEHSRDGLDNPGFCVVCGHEQEGCEPDAREHWCEVCGQPKVYGAEELLIYLVA